jgi:hypothetical protein
MMAMRSGMSEEQMMALVTESYQSKKFKLAVANANANAVAPPAPRIESGQPTESVQRPQLTESNLGRLDPVLSQHATVETAYAPSERGDAPMGGTLSADHPNVLR